MLAENQRNNMTLYELIRGKRGGRGGKKRKWKYRGDYWVYGGTYMGASHNNTNHVPRGNGEYKLVDNDTAGVKTMTEGETPGGGGDSLVGEEVGGCFEVVLG